MVPAEATEPGSAPVAVLDEVLGEPCVSIPGVPSLHTDCAARRTVLPGLRRRPTDGRGRYAVCTCCFDPLHLKQRGPFPMTRQRRRRRGAVIDPHQAHAPRTWAQHIRSAVSLSLGLAVLVGISGLMRRPSASRTPPGDAGVGVEPLEPGDLAAEIRTVPIPESLLPRQAWGGPRRWRLPGYDRPRALALLSGLRGAEGAMRCDASGCALEPELEEVAALPPTTRSRIYGALVRIDANPQTENTFYRPQELGPFSAVPGLPAQARPWLDALTWSDDGVPAFSDIAVVCHRLGGPDACQTFMRAMLSRPSWSVSLRVAEPGAIERIASTFGVERREAVRRQLAGAHEAGAAQVPLADMLPAWARERLGTFPRPDEEWTNCFWTALRFVDAARGVVGDGAAMDLHLRRDFSPVASGPRMGDVLILRDAEGHAVHAATWLLGGYLFEKNGHGRLQAWRVVPLSHVMAEFPRAGAAELWRLRNSP